MIDKVPTGSADTERLTDYYQGEIFLITPDQFENNVLDGTTLVDIFGEYVVKGRDTVSLETRGRYVAMGFPIDKAPNWIDQSTARKHKTREMSDADRRDIRKIGKTI